MHNDPGWARRLQLLLLLSAAAAPRPIAAQLAPTTSQRDRFWLNGGFGFGRSGSGPADNTGLATGFTVTYQPSALLFSVRVAGVWNVFAGDLLGDVAILAGLGTRGSSSHISFSVGPALTGGTLRAYSRDSTSFGSRLGAALQVQLLGLPVESLGLGVTGFADLNAHRSFGGLMFSLAVGQLR